MRKNRLPPTARQRSGIMVLTKELMITSAAASAPQHRAKMPIGVATADESPAIATAINSCGDGMPCVLVRSLAASVVPCATAPVA